MAISVKYKYILNYHDMRGGYDKLCGVVRSLGEKQKKAEDKAQKSEQKVAELEAKLEKLSGKLTARRCKIHGKTCVNLIKKSKSSILVNNLYLQ